MIIEEIIDEFELFDNWEEKYSHIIELGKKLPNFDDEYKIAKNKISGCVSNVWLISKKNGENLEFLADSDAIIVRGLLAILLRIFSDKSPKEIIAIDIKNIFERIGFARSLTPTRSNGFFAVVEKIKSIAENNI